MVECLPGTYSDEHPPKYEPISVSSGCGLSMTRRMFMGPDAQFRPQAQQYILQRLAATY